MGQSQVSFVENKRDTKMGIGETRARLTQDLGETANVKAARAVNMYLWRT